MNMRETVLKSLSAVGAQHEAKFYADLFARQDAETFAMIVLDPVSYTHLTLPTILLV